MAAVYSLDHVHVTSGLLFKRTFFTNMYQNEFMEHFPNCGASFLLEIEHAL